MPQSVINKVTQNATGNYSAGTGKFDPGKIRGAILHPYDADLLSTADLATATTRKTALQALLRPPLHAYLLPAVLLSFPMRMP